MKIENLDRAQVFYGLARNGALSLLNRYGRPALFTIREAAEIRAAENEHIVRVYIVVEDD